MDTSACEWCDDFEPMRDSDTGIDWAVQEYADGHFHPPCHETYMRYETIGDVLRHCRTRGEARELIGLAQEEYKDDFLVESTIVPESSGNHPGGRNN